MDCDDRRTLLASLPGLYQPSELQLYKIPVDDNAYASTKTEPVIDDSFKKAFSEAKKEILKNILANERFNAVIEEYTVKPVSESDKELLYKHLQQFYGRIQMHTKSEYFATLNTGFGWTIQKLNAQKVLKWVLLAENLTYLGEEISDMRLYENPILSRNYLYRFKSTDWIGNLFLNSCLKSRDESKRRIPETLSCPLGSSAAMDDMERSVITDNDTFVLFDDGAYSGQQKADILNNFIQTVHKIKQDSKLIITIPYYTFYAIEKLQKVITDYVYINQPDRVKKISTKFDKTQRYYKIETEFHTVERTHKKLFLGITVEKNVPKKTLHTTHIYLWMGGSPMQDSLTILQSIAGDNEAALMRLVEYLGYSGKYLTPWMFKFIGATLTLFEHKIPDDLSLNRAIGDSLYDEPHVKSHYTFNPPYKLKVDDYFDANFYDDIALLFNPHYRGAPSSDSDTSASRASPGSATSRATSRASRESDAPIPMEPSKLTQLLRTYYKMNAGATIFTTIVAPILKLLQMEDKTKDKTEHKTERYSFAMKMIRYAPKQLKHGIYSLSIAPLTPLLHVTLVATSHKKTLENDTILYIPDHRFPFALRFIVQTTTQSWVTVSIANASTTFNMFPPTNKADAIAHVAFKPETEILLRTVPEVSSHKQDYVKALMI